MSCEVVKLIGVTFEVKIDDITLKKKNIVLSNDSVHLCYISSILLQHFYYFCNFLFQLVVPNISASKFPYPVTQ